MTPHEFIKKWKPVSLSERATAQEHFIDLCRLFDHPTPVEEDPTGGRFTFEKGLTKTGGGQGFADVWKRGSFAWEYKKKRRSLDEALVQLSRYSAALENPPLHVVCDTDRFKIVTAWTNTVPKTYEIELDDLLDSEKRDILHAVFHDPEKLKPARTRSGLTKDAADKFSGISASLQRRGHKADAVAHFVNQLVFCFFANSVKLLPEGVFPKLLRRAQERPARANGYFDKLFAAMEKGGELDFTDVAHFNGGLFDGRGALPLEQGEIGLLVAAAGLDWSQIDPTIFGSLFERFLDPDKRAQIGAHYTDPEKIMMLVEPVVIRPLKREWAEARADIARLAEAAHLKRGRAFDAAMAKAEERRSQFLKRLHEISILDPACGSGNFLYLALQAVKDIELLANSDCEAMGLEPRLPQVGPEILHGIEINTLAAELARTTIWIGDIQWGVRNAIYSRPEPILRKLDAIECRDAVLAQTPDGSYVEAQWPAVDFIIGNPPFLGGKVMRQGRRSKLGENSGLGDEYVDALFSVYAGKVPAEADFVCYWFVKAWQAMQAGRAQRVGLVATNSIRGGANRRTLDPIAAEVKIFEAWSDEPWIVEGAAVRVSLVCFGADDEKRLDGREVARINADLTSKAIDLTTVSKLRENANISFQGFTKGAPFEVTRSVAVGWLKAPLNPNGLSNSIVLRPIVSGGDIAKSREASWVVDFSGLTEQEAALFEAPFQYVLEFVRPTRSTNKRELYRQNWWLFARLRPGFRGATSGLTRYIATPKVSRWRFFVWLPKIVAPDNLVVAIARDDDTAFGLLHSRFHEAWTLACCAWIGSGNDPTYTPTTTFETFPFPEGLTPNIQAADYAADPRAIRIAEAARRLDELRRAWLNPPDLIKVEPEVVPGYPDRILPKDAEAARTLKERTLTNLYNQRPQWLADAHAALDRAVASAYGWPEDISTEEALEKLLALNLARVDKAKV
jgi:type II restriction/modification system DNA methylase subunit YeeA